MSFLLDTNLISELRKNAKCNRAVWTWYEAQSFEDLFLSVLTTGEIRKGVEKCRMKDVPRAQAYETWLRGLENGFKERILPVTAEIADMWGRLTYRVPMPAIDGLLAATAQYYSMTVVTRNERDFQRCGVDYINPFEA